MVLSFLKINDKMVCITRAKFILSHKNSLENKDKFNICLLHTNLKICFNAPLLLFSVRKKLCSNESDAPDLTDLM